MVWIAAAISVWGLLASFAFLRWLDARYPGAERAPTAGSETDARLTALENRLTTIELQRGILRQVPNR